MSLLAARHSLAEPRPMRLAAAAARTPQFDRRTGLAEMPVNNLVTAAAHADRAEIGRWAERLGPAKLTALLTGSDRVAATAALEGARTLEGNVRLLGPITRLLSEEPRLAERAAVALGEILRADQLSKALDWEVPPDELASACGALTRLAESVTAPVSLRTAAIGALAEAHAFCPVNPPLGALTKDGWPEVRRAVVLAPQIIRVKSIDDVGDLSGDQVPSVAGAAEAVWCRYKLDALRKGDLNSDARRKLARMRALVMMENVPAEDVVEMLPCLGVSHDPDDQHAFEVARQRHADAR